MRKKQNITFLIWVAILLMSCDGYEQYYPNLGANANSGDYLINPDKILTMLEQDNQNVFLPMTATPSPNDELLPYGSFYWTQNDYMKIARALSLYVWEDEMEDWQVFSIDFKRDCRTIHNGFDSFTAIYFKEITINSEKQYTTRQIDIYPLAKQVTWGDGSEYPYSIFKPWYAIDFPNFKISADKAFQIAEENGGADARLARNNECGIIVSSSQNYPNKWSVSYYILASFQVLINPYNGKFETFTEFQ